MDARFHETSSLARLGFQSYSWSTALIGFLVIKAVFSLILKQSAGLTAYSNISYFLLLLMATGFAILNAVQNTQGGRSFWVLLAAGYGLWLLDQWFWVYYEVGLHIKIPDSSIADPALFLHIIPFMVALVTLPHLGRSSPKLHRTTVNLLLLLFLWVFLYAYLLFPYQYLFWNTKIYNFRYNILYLVENLALVVALAVLSLRALPPWRSIYHHLFGACALYALSSAVANFAIDSGGYSYTSLYALGQDAAVCWFVWVPLYARQLPQAEIGATPPSARHSKYTSLFAMLAVVGISLIGLWDLFQLDQSPGMRRFRLLVVLIFVVFLAFAVFLREYAANRELVADVQVSNLQQKLSEAALGHSEALKGSILSSLENLIAVINKDGVIVDVNESWTRGVQETGMPSWSAGVGTNYLETLRRSADLYPEAREVLAIVQAVMKGSVPRLRYDYRYDSSLEPRWFAVTVTPLRTHDGGVVICYKDITDVKKVEARYGELVETARAIVWRAEVPTFQITYASKQAEEILGYPPESWVKEPGFWKDHIHPEDRERVLALTAKATQEKRKHDFECRMIAADGRTVWLHNIIKVIVENNQPRELVGVTVDITARKKTEVALKESEDRYRDLVEHSQDLICTHDLKGRLLSVNPAVARALGYEIAKLLQMSIPDLLATRDRSLFDAYVAQIRRDAVAAGSMRVITRAGEERIWEYHNTLRTQDTPEPIVRGMARDVTDRRRAEKALRESEERFRLAAQAGKMYAYEWDIATDMVIRSEEHVSVLGFSDQAKQFTRQQLLARVHPDDRALFTGSVEQLTPENPTTQARYRVLRHDGSVVWLQNSARAFFDRQGTMLRVIGMVADITQRKLSEEALARVSRRLIEAQEQERTRIARDLHDDIGQRLALLTVELEQLRTTPPDSPAKVSSRMGELWTQASDIATDVQSLSHELHSSKLEYLGLEAAVRGFCQEFSEQQNVEIDYKSHDLPSAVSPDISLSLFRVLQEALHNSAKHSGVRHFEVRLWGTSDEIHLTVKDSGAGFDRETAKESRGLGLISMEERLKLVKGTLSIESQLKRGTTIHARAPLRGVDSLRAAG